MFRLLVLLVLGILVALWVEPGWNANERKLTLRLRDAGELQELARGRARDLADRAAEGVVSRWRGDPPSVSSAPPEASAEHLTGDERRRLDRLVREKTRAD